MINLEIKINKDEFKKKLDLKDGVNGSPDTAYQIVEKLESIDNESEKLKIEAIQNLREELDDLKKKWASRPIFGGGGFSVGAMNFHFYHDEVGTGDDVTTVFSLDNIPSPTDSLEVWIGTANQWITDDYTLSGNQITFLTAPPTGAKIRAKYRT